MVCGVATDVHACRDVEGPLQVFPIPRRPGARIRGGKRPHLWNSTTARADFPSSGEAP